MNEKNTFASHYVLNVNRAIEQDSILVAWHDLVKVNKGFISNTGDDCVFVYSGRPPFLLSIYLYNSYAPMMINPRWVVSKFKVCYWVPEFTCLSGNTSSELSPQLNSYWNLKRRGSTFLIRKTALVFQLATFLWICSLTMVRNDVTLGKETSKYTEEAESAWNTLKQSIFANYTLDHVRSISHWKLTG